MPRAFWITGLLCVLVSNVRSAEVAGRVVVPEICTLSGGVAVASLEPLDGQTTESPPDGEIGAEIDQKGLQFLPRVSAIQLGQGLRITNGDPEVHSVHNIEPGYQFLNQTMPPGGSIEYLPEKPGVLRIVCDIHSHMRTYVVVSDSPWVRACRADGGFNFRDVPPGRYALKVWHEMGEPLQQTVTVKDGANLDLGTLILKGPENAQPIAQDQTRQVQDPTKPRTWPDVIDQICLLLSKSQDTAKTTAGTDRAVALIDDAYLGEFEASDMETAVRAYLGISRASEIENQFRDLRRQTRAVAKEGGSVDPLSESGRVLLVSLGKASADLQAKGLNSRAEVLQPGLALSGESDPAPGDVRPRLTALKRSFLEVADLADQGNPDASAGALMSAYWDDFEPIERDLKLRDPATVRRLEGGFMAVRGRIMAGMTGAPLSSELETLHADINQAAGALQSDQAGTFGLGFMLSLGTILREGVEVILLLTMLFALASKAGERRATMAVLIGAGAALVASAFTALGLFMLVRSASGMAREVLEGVIALTASGVLFYVSYWLISQSQSNRWVSFLKQQARRTLGVAAFLAVYREGAETALMYQALLAGQTSKEGYLG
ncbi:MAG: FTR1 family protein, partial [Isosphaeraceae bacterium]